MVGIPGKSKGCHTCRRRKIKCDLEEPNCNRCRQSGRICEGYKRGAVFLNRTVQGLEKRKRLEEAQPRQDHSSSSASPPSDTNSQTATPITENTRLGGEIGNSAYPVVRRLSTAKVVKAKLQGIFLEAYLPANPSDGPGVYRDWLCEVVSLNNPGKVLEYSLHALCITQAGRVGGNKALVVQGNMTYGFALKELQKALLSPRQASKDETLAACYILSIYELFESTSQSIAGHENHLLGVERLVHFRGPRQHETRMGLALLKNICYSSMVKSLQYRKKSLLKDMIDKIQWQQRDLILWSKGHALGALLQDLDEYAAVRPEHHSPLGLTQHLRTALAIDAELQIWYQQLLQESPSPLYWPSTGNGQDGGGFSFVNLQLAHLLLDLWALRLIVSVTVTALSHQIPLPTLKLDWQSPAGSTDSDSEEMPSHARDAVTFIHQARADYNACQQMKLATNIMESLPFCMKDENGISSSQKCLFGARVALILLKRRQSEKLASYEALYDSLSADKGISWAKGVESTESIRTWEKKI